jgi:acetyltransferase-like isoleucine patch superfamily enzyme
MTRLLGRIVSKLDRMLAACRLRLQHGLYRGKLDVESSSLSGISLGTGNAFRGLLMVRRAAASLGAGCRVAQTAEICCADQGVIVLGEGVALGPRTIVSTTRGRIEIGARTSFFSDCLISGEIRIGEDCLFANNVTVLTGNHEIYGGGTIRENDEAAVRRPGYQPLKPVVIGPDCWLGANSVILPGVTLGKGCVVGANAVVTKSFPDYSILAGVPAAVIGSRLDDRRKNTQ